jgi:hypothetical protein
MDGGVNADARGVRSDVGAAWLSMAGRQTRRGNGGVLTPQGCVQQQPSTGFGYRHIKEGAAIVEEVQPARQRYGNLSANTI